MQRPNLPPQQPAEYLVEIGGEICLARGRGRGIGANHKQATSRQRPQVPAGQVTQPPPHFVPHYRGAYRPADNEPDPGRLRLFPGGCSREQVNGNQRPDGTTSLAHRCGEICAVPHPGFCWKHERTPNLLAGALLVSVEAGPSRTLTRRATTGLRGTGGPVAGRGDRLGRSASGGRPAWQALSGISGEAVLPDRHLPRSGLSNAEPLASLTATCGKNGPARAGAHTQPEAVRLRAPTVVRLERTLTHWDSRCCAPRGGMWPWGSSGLYTVRATIPAGQTRKSRLLAARTLPFAERIPSATPRLWTTKPGSADEGPWPVPGHAHGTRG